MTGSKPAALPLGYTPAGSSYIVGRHLLTELNKMAGVRGFEPLNDGIKTRCLTAWLYPYNVMVREERLELSHPEDTGT